MDESDGTEIDEYDMLVEMTKSSHDVVIMILQPGERWAKSVISNPMDIQSSPIAGTHNTEPAATVEHGNSENEIHEKCEKSMYPVLF